MAHSPSQDLDGPFLEDLEVGVPLRSAPSVTVDEGVCTLYRALCGDAPRLTLSHPLARAVTGDDMRPVNPGLVLQLAIGQSTVATRRVIANLFYRDVVVLESVCVGDTITTTVTPQAVQLASSGARGKVLLALDVADESGGRIAHFQRCALVPARDRSAVVESGDVGTSSSMPLDHFLNDRMARWDLDPLRGDGGGRWEIGEVREDPVRDTVSGPLEFVRLLVNQAMAHRDHRFGQAGHRLVYGGHTVAMAQAALTRLTPELAVVVGWQGCDHLAPVFEGDVLRMEARCVDAVETAGGRLLEHEVVGYAERSAGPDEETPVLSWRPVSLVAR